MNHLAVDAFMPHGMCYLWRPDILALHVGSDLLIALAYFSIPAALLTFVRRRPDIRFRKLLLLFTGFILACGVTHAMGIVVVWEPLYVIQGFLKLATALISVSTAVVLWPLIPRVVAIPSPVQLEARNAEIEALNVQLRQRIDSLTTLAGGISHDFNNLLTVILGNAETLEREPALAQHQRSLSAIQLAGERAAGLCRRMLAYSGRGHFLLELQDLNAGIRPTIEGLRAKVGAPDASLPRLHTDLADGLPHIEAAERQLGELVEELVDNAREALQEDTRAGEIRISTYLETFDADTLATSRVEHQLAPGSFVVLEVADDGPGMAPDVVERMFEPYFSTRFTGRGLGLSAVHGITRGHGAALFVDSTPGRGTRIRIAFRTEPPPETAFRPVDPARRERSLVVVLDDEPELLALARQSLARLGLEAHATTDPDDALDVVRKDDGRLRAVLLDYQMPRRSGDKVLFEIRKISSVDVWMTSGFSHGATPGSSPGPGRGGPGSPFGETDPAGDPAPSIHQELAGFIAKPYGEQELRRIFLTA
ncbi:MAG: ATP-binding protein [Gammaproteobacteria bacterium]